MSNCNNYNQSWSYDREPTVQLFEHANCEGAYASIPIGTYIAGKITDGTSLGQRGVFPNYAMSSMYVPPHANSEVHEFWDNDSNQYVATFSPGWYRDGSALNRTTAYYHNGIYKELRNVNWNDLPSGVTAYAGEPWHQYASDCCYGRYGTKSADRCTSPAGNSIYGPNSDPSCSTPLSAECKASVYNAFHAPLCQEWYAGNGASAETPIKNYLCNGTGGLQTRECRDWCRANPGKCDSGSQAYCALYPQESYCGCITSPVTRYNPKCVDSWCIGGVDASGIGGYVTASQNSTGQCPSIIDCQTNIDLEAAGRITTGNVTVSNNCGNTATTCSAIEDNLGQMRDGQLGDRLCAGRTNPTTMICTDAGWVIDRTGSNMCPTATTPPVGGGPAAGMNMYILIFIVVLVLAVGGFVFFKRKGGLKNKTNKNTI